MLKKGLARRSFSEVGGLAQLARAPALQAGGHRFDSDILHSDRRSHGEGDQKGAKLGVGRNKRRQQVFVRGYC